MVCAKLANMQEPQRTDQEYFSEKFGITNVQMAKIDATMTIFKFTTADTDQLLRTIKSVIALYPRQAVACRVSFREGLRTIQSYNVDHSPFLEVRMPISYLDQTSTPRGRLPVVESLVTYQLMSNFDDRVLHMEISDDATVHQPMKRDRVAEVFVDLISDLQAVASQVAALPIHVKSSNPLPHPAKVEQVRIDTDHRTVGCLLVLDPDHTTDGSAMCAAALGTGWDRTTASNVFMTHWINDLVIKSYA